MDYKIKEGQSIYDLAILYGYGVERVVEFLAAAPQLRTLDNNTLGGTNIDVTKINTNLSLYLNLYSTGISSAYRSPEVVFGSEEQTVIYISEDGNNFFGEEN